MEKTKEENDKIYILGSIKNIDSFKSIWDTVIHHRSSGTFPLNPKEASILIL
jgi:hypothetical protein